MDKKEYLLRILTQLEPIWNLAKGLKILVEGGHLDDNLLEALIQAVKGAIYTTKDELAKRKLQKGLDALQKMKQIEAESKAKDEQDLAELDKMLEEI